MAFVVEDCIRCGTKKVQMNMLASVALEHRQYEIAVTCQACGQLSIFHIVNNANDNGPQQYGDANLSSHKHFLMIGPVRMSATAPNLSDTIPPRIAGLFIEAAVSRQLGHYEAAGAIFRKTVDVATKHLYRTDKRLEGRNPADALRSRIRALGEMKILEMDIVELADVAALDGNDATHDEDPYNADEAEALEDLTMDLLDRLYVRPARLAAVRAKQIAAGQRKPDA